MKKLLMTSFVVCVMVYAALSVPELAMADESAWDKTKSGVSEVWGNTRQAADGAGQWTLAHAGKAWDATCDGARHLAAWSGEKLSAGWQATKNGVSEVASLR